MVYAVRAKDLVNMNRMKELAFGYYAWTEDGYGLATAGEEGFEEGQVKQAGSGALVAPGLGLTAKHVGKAFETLDMKFDAMNRRKTPLDPQYQTKKVAPDFATMVYQMPTCKGELVQWKADVGWPSHDTDIETLVVHPGSPAAEAAAPGLKYFPWQLLPPRKGELVWVYGWPKQKIKIEDNDHEWKVELRVEPAWVDEIIYPLTVHRMSDFPGFRLRTRPETDLARGMSGGPVLYNGRLVGIFTGPDLVANLWPLALMTYPISKEDNAREYAFAEHFDSGFIDASYDWNDVKGRADRVHCKEAVAGTDIDPCNRMHAVLRS